LPRQQFLEREGQQKKKKKRKEKKQEKIRENREIHKQEVIYNTFDRA
jgi:hypothetical protein